MLSSEVVVLPATPVTAYRNVGRFGVKSLIGSHIYWYYCREMFHKGVDCCFWVSGFYFSCYKEQREAIVEFIDIIETRLGLDERTQFNRTNIPTVLWVKPAPFWHKQRMRYSLFTILMRAAGGHISGQPIELAAKNNHYLKGTYRAFTYFMSGHNRYTGWQSGWYNVFAPIPCCTREKCIHADRRCRRWLDNLLVPDWQVFPIHYFYRIARWFSRS